MTLTERIKQFYLQNNLDLSPGRRFHLASRLAAWDGSPEALEILRSSKEYLLPGRAQKVLLEIMAKPPGKVYGQEQRSQYFEKYPKLFGVHNALFRIRHLKEVYGIDISDELLKIISMDELTGLHNELLSDGNAVRTLARFAVDYFYLLEILYGIPAPDPEFFFNLKDGYDLNDPAQVHFLISLYTHCVIADSNFYIRQVAGQHLPVYRQMLAELTKIIKVRKDIKLDNQFEYLVTQRICGLESPLSQKIYQQANDSLDASKNFIIDKLLEKHNPALNTFNNSEHRNVLFIMSCTPFNPHSTLIT